jgi:hypothetical protein
MTRRELAFVLLRCSGAISIVVGLFYAAAYVPMLWDVAFVKSTGSLWRSTLIPTLSGVMAGLVLFLLSGPLSKLIARDPK